MSVADRVSSNFRHNYSAGSMQGGTSIDENSKPVQLQRKFIRILLLVNPAPPEQERGQGKARSVREHQRRQPYLIPSKINPNFQSGSGSSTSQKTSSLQGVLPNSISSKQGVVEET